MYTNCLLTEIRLFSTKLGFKKNQAVFLALCLLIFFFILKGAAERLFDGLNVSNTQQKAAEKNEIPPTSYIVPNFTIAIKRVQRRATRMIPELKGLSYKENLQSLRLETLQYRGKWADLLEVYRILNNIRDIDTNCDYSMSREENA